MLGFKLVTNIELCPPKEGSRAFESRQVYVIFKEEFMQFYKPPHFSTISVLLKMFAWGIVVCGFLKAFNAFSYHSPVDALYFGLGSLLVFALLFALANLLENSMATVDFPKQLLELQQAQVETKKSTLSEKIYSVKIGERECGNFNLEQLLELLKSGEIDDNCEVHDEGDIRWHKLCEHKVYSQLV